MKSTIYKIKSLISTFENMKDGKDHKGTKFSLDEIDRAPGSGIPADLIAHQQGMYRLDANNNFIVTGSAKNNPGYFYIIKNGEGYDGNDGKDYWPIDYVMTHPGGIQVAEDILVIGNEQYSGATTRSDRSNIRFYNISDPDAVVELTHLGIERRGDGKIASAVGLTKLGEQWILAVRALDTMDFYSLYGYPSDRENSFSELSSIGLDDNGMKQFQCVNLFLDAEEKLFLFGMPDGSSTNDECWLYQLNAEKDSEGITNISSAEEMVHKHFYRDGSGPRFKWASCVCFESDDDSQENQETKGKFIVYSAAGHVDNNKIACNKWDQY